MKIDRKSSVTTHFNFSLNIVKNIVKCVFLFVFIANSNEIVSLFKYLFTKTIVQNI